VPQITHLPEAVGDTPRQKDSIAHTKRRAILAALKQILSFAHDENLVLIHMHMEGRTSVRVPGIFEKRKGAIRIAGRHFHNTDIRSDMLRITGSIFSGSDHAKSSGLMRFGHIEAPSPIDLHPIGLAVMVRFGHHLDAFRSLPGNLDPHRPFGEHSLFLPSGFSIFNGMF
jgi:hypothetical protein